MLEILFTESAAGGLKYAKNYGRGEYKAPAVSFIIPESGSLLSDDEMATYRKKAEAEQQAKWEKAVPMDIDSRDIVPLAFGLATGDISEDYPAEKRQMYFEKMNSIYPEFRNGQDTGRWFDKIRQSIEKVVETVKNNEPVRLWYSDNPDELCGLYHLVYLIDKINTDCEIYTVKLPALYIREDDTIISYNGWGGVPPEEWHLHFKSEKMTKAFKTLCITSWRQLKADNAPVRVLLNGKVQSMPEDIYDSFIIREITKQDKQFRQAIVIGNVLGKYQLRVSDAFIAHRMEKMIEKGVLTIVEEASADSPVYHRILERNI